MSVKDLQNEQTVNSASSALSLLTTPCVGYIVGKNSNQEVLVQTNKTSPKPARLLANIDRADFNNDKAHGREVLLVFENGDPNKPIIVGLMEDPLEKLVSLELATDESETNNDITIDGKRVTLEAEDEVMLKCGKGSILIRKDGRIIVKGTNILSRASGPNRVKGASVALN